MNFDWLEKKLQQQIEGQWYGELLSFFHGTGLEIADFRPYQAGDSPRNINWKLSAKHDQLWINKRQEEKDIQVDILLDINANRSAGRRQTNRDTAQEWLADYLVFAKKSGLQTTTVFAPQQGVMKQYACSSISGWLAGWTQWEEEVKLQSTQSSYTSVLSDFLSTQVQQKKQRVLLLFSDFLALEKNQQQQLVRLDQQHIMAQVMIDVPEVVGRNFITL